MYKKILLIIILFILLSVSGCAVSDDAKTRGQKETIFIGIDVSASFFRSGYYEKAIKFISYYIYGHLNRLGGLSQPKTLFVASIGGFSPDEPKSFRPIHDFESKSVEQIEKDLKEWLIPRQTITDFNVFFERIKELIQKKNLILTPINIVIVTDGEPTRYTSDGKNVIKVPYNKINISSLEYLARNITIRLLYPSPVIADKWDKEVPRTRVRIWHVDYDVMRGWESKVIADEKPEKMEKLWQWIKDNVDYRVRKRVFSKK